jgi:hypothetical protein
MKKLATTSLAALMAVSAVMPAMTTSAEAGHGRGVAIGAGVILGAAALAAAANAADAREYRRSRWRQRCRYWYNRCEDGSDWACEKYENRCDY